MPRENRKRGKKHKKQTAAENEHPYKEDANPVLLDEIPEQTAGPSWIVDSKKERENLDAPFGYVDPDVKAYFKTVDTRLREWQEATDTVDVDEGEEVDPNEERRLFLVAALTELSGKEKQLATDPDCSNILERMAYSMDDFVKRVFLDRMAGSYEQMFKHRFGSHVIQTLLSVGKGTICREAKGILPQSESEADQGTLPTLTQLVLALCEEVLPSISSLVLDPFASHVIRSLFLLLCPFLPSAEQPSSILRSKKSAKYRAKQGPMKSVFTEDNDGDAKGKEVPNKVPYPPEFDEMARRIVTTIKDTLSPNEVRALAADKAACPVLVLLLEMESVQGRSNENGSVMDTVSAGLISACLKTPLVKPEPSDYVATLLRDSTSSHLLEKLVILAPDLSFDVLWEQYFQGKLNRLSVHPVANFVVARAVGRLNADQLRECLGELDGSWSKIIKTSKTGVLKAAIDRATELKEVEERVCDVIENAFSLSDTEKRLALVWCVLYLTSYADYAESLPVESKTSEQSKNTVKRPMALEPTVQGSVLVQSLLRFSEPHNRPIVESVLSQPPHLLLTLSQNPISSRILDAFLSSPTVPSRSKRKLIMAFLEHYHELVDDRIGSRVGDRLWAAADPYLKEKIARSLAPHEQHLLGSFYGKFFVRGLNLYLLRRSPEEWKAQQAKDARKDHSTTGAGSQLRQPIKLAEERSTEGNTLQDGSSGKAGRDKKKRKRGADKPEDEIDALFSSALGKKQKKGNLGPVVDEQKDLKDSGDKSKIKSLSTDRDLDSVLGAIRTAPNDLKGSKKK